MSSHAENQPGALVEVRKVRRPVIEDAIESLVVRARQEDRLKTKDQLEKEFDAFYSAVKGALVKQGTFSEGGLDPEADFASSMWVDPSRVIHVTCEVPLATLKLQPLVDAMGKDGIERAVVLDGGAAFAVVFSTGKVLTRE